MLPRNNGRMTGFWVVLATGLVLLAVAAGRDRASRLAVERATGGAGLPRRPQPPAPDATTRRDLDDFRAAHQALGLQLVHPAMATWWDPPLADLAWPEVLCCDAPPSGLRELLASRAAARRLARPLLVACPVPDDDALAELVAVADGQLVVLTGDDEAVRALAAAARARVTSRADLQSGASGASHGRLERLVAGRDGCWVQAVEA